MTWNTNPSYLFEPVWRAGGAVLLLRLVANTYLKVWTFSHMAIQFILSHCPQHAPHCLANLYSSSLAVKVKKNKKKTKINISCFGCWFVFAFSNLWASNFFPAHIIPCQRVTRKERLSYYHRSDDFCIYPHHFRTGNTKQTIYYMLILQIKSLIWKRQGEMDCHLLFC